MKLVTLVVSLFSSISFASSLELNNSVGSSPWLGIRSPDGKVNTFLHQDEFKKPQSPKEVSFLSIYQMDKDAPNSEVMKKAKKESKVNDELTPGQCYETDSKEPGIKQTWCDTKKPYFVVVIEGGPIRMKENERTRIVLAEVLGAKDSAQ